MPLRGHAAFPLGGRNLVIGGGALPDKTQSLRRRFPRRCGGPGPRGQFLDAFGPDLSRRQIDQFPSRHPHVRETIRLPAGIPQAHRLLQSGQAGIEAGEHHRNLAASFCHLHGMGAGEADDPGIIGPPGMIGGLAFQGLHRFHRHPPVPVHSRQEQAQILMGSVENPHHSGVIRRQGGPAAIAIPDEPS